MSKCSVCGNEVIMCICPKGLGGGEKPSDAEESKAYRDKVEQVSSAIFEKCTDIYKKDAAQLRELLDALRIILDDESTDDLLKQLENDITFTSDGAVFKENFKRLRPNMAMLDALSQGLNLGVFPSPANELSEGIKLSLAEKTGFPPYPEHKGGNFQEALQTYATYYQNLPPKQQEQLSEVFWAQIRKLGTPIIESKPDKPDQCGVYFLLPKSKLSQSKTGKGTKKDLYLQGDFHGYDFTQDRQRVNEFANTGIMLKQNSMPKDAIITYRYVQIEPAFKNLSATQIHGSDKVEEPPTTFFPDKDAEGTPSPRILPVRSDKLSYDSSQMLYQPDANITDEYNLHRPPYFEANGAERILRINPDSNEAKLGGKQVSWVTLLSNGTSHFKHYKTLYSTLDGGLHAADPLYRKSNAGPEELFSSDKNSPYADCTRAIHVFEPTSGKVDHVVIINDGFAYLGLDGMSQFEKMVGDGKLSENTAFVFITPLPALLKTIQKDDPKASMPGMGARTVEYEHRIDEYAAFLRDDLFPTLKNGGLNIPDAPDSRVMVGSSASGTASIYIGFKYPGIIGSVVAQSPSPSNRSILKEIVEAHQPTKPRAHIELSCGIFEQPGFAENTNLPFAKELSKKLEIPLAIGQHGHQFIAWTEGLERSIPSALSLQSTQIHIPAELASGGKVKLSSKPKDGTDDVIVMVTYTPDTPPSDQVFFGNRDRAGIGKMVKMDQLANGSFQVTLEMKQNESREFSMHIGQPLSKPDFSDPQHFKSHISLIDGMLVIEAYPNLSLTEKQKGTLQKRRLLQAGTLSEPISEDETVPSNEVIYIHLPAGYDQTKSYPIQIMLDGDMHVTEDSFGNCTHTPRLLDNLLATGKIGPAITIFTSPSKPLEDGSNQRLREYACNLETDRHLCQLPQAVAKCGLSVKQDDVTLCGQSLGGLQAIYSAKMHPDIFTKVIAQSPAVWWSPPETMEGDSAFYNQDNTWREPLRKPFPVKFDEISEEEKQVLQDSPYEGYIHHMLKTGFDTISNKPLLAGDVQIILQAGTHETGVVSPFTGKEPLFQATKTLAQQLDIPMLVHDGAHSSEPWAAGLSKLLPMVNQPIQQATLIKRKSVEVAMKKAHISGVSIATVNPDGYILTTALGTSNTEQKNAVTPNTVFGAASLSKPVFAYLVLKLIEDNQFTLDTKLSELLATQGRQIEDLNIDGLQLDPAQKVKAEQLTVGMVLSHMTGFPIGADTSKPLQFEFDPSEQKYGYSGIGIAYLQKAIETATQSGLETLAQHYIFKPLGMHHSHFEPARFEPDTTFAGEVRPEQAANAANSLHTTACDYAKFLTACMQDENLQSMFNPRVTMTKDDWAIRENVSQKDLQHTAWGLGFGIQTDDDGKPVSAYHSGDMNEWRAWAAMDLKTKSAVVYFSNSHNGHVLAEQIVFPVVRLEHASNYFFQKYGFARSVDELGENLNNHGLRASHHCAQVTKDYRAQVHEIKKEKIEHTLSSAAPKPTPTFDSSK